MASDVVIVSQPRDSLTRYRGTSNRRFTAFTVGASSKVAVGEYSIRIRPSPRTSKRALPRTTVAPGAAFAAPKSTGVARFTGDVGEVASVCAAAAAGTASAATATTDTTAAIRG